MKRSSFSSVLSDAPPAHWFADPELAEPTPITITDEGRVYGHAALWGTCHVGIPGSCVSPPRSQCGYGAYHLGGRRTSDGQEVAVGTITLGTTHAGMTLGASATKRHYEDTGYGVADVRVGEDRWGPWFAGAVRRGVTEPQVEELRAAKISGDWRERNGSLELVGLLAVNVPGYPVPRPAARSAVAASGYSGRTALVAANPVPRSARVREALVAGINAYDAELERRAEVAELMARVQVPVLLARALG